MNNKLMIIVVAFFLLLMMGVYFLVNPSYEQSVKAKYYYEIGEYEQALVLSKEAFSLDQYNRMAATVMAQSITSLKYVKYINMAKGYIIEIDEIAKHEYISDADKAKIRLMCEVMISSYIKLAPSVVTDKKLVEESAYYYQKFENLLEKVNRKI
jgi:tetratricopeptide (TPR) repeat protein